MASNYVTPADNVRSILGDFGECGAEKVKDEQKLVRYCHDRLDFEILTTDLRNELGVTTTPDEIERTCPTVGALIAFVERKRAE